METFTAAKGFMENPGFHEQRRDALEQLDLGTVDMPIIDIIESFAEIPCCFTLQSCCGHFLFVGREDPHSIDPLPELGDDVEVSYRIAYITLCIEESEQGRTLLSELAKVPALDHKYIQFGCAGWFWERQVNSYVLQAEPERFKNSDTATIFRGEALHIEKTRDVFFTAIKRLLSDRLDAERGSGRPA